MSTSVEPRGWAKAALRQWLDRLFIFHAPIVLLVIYSFSDSRNVVHGEVSLLIGTGIFSKLKCPWSVIKL